ncbi:MAG: RNA methyltransferase [Opitutaceae bacterium]|jgi:RNA methyltransferase, TrmH family|nr:RNA methyltransferase [Opitutaceae bacterium]
MSLTKAEIAHLRGLRLKKNREAAQAFVVEGPKVVAELVAAGHAFESIFATADWTQYESAPTEIIAESAMAKISHFPTPSCVLAVGKIERSELTPGEINNGFTLALDGIQDPGNVGTMLRIADWFGFDRVLLSPDCADLFSQKVINASMGSFARMLVVTTDLKAALQETTSPILGCDLEGQPLHDVSPPASAVVVLGSEGQGISSAMAQLLTQRVTIPRRGGAESLNAAVAAGIVCAHLRS